MRTHIHFDRHGWPQSVNNYLAMDGFQQMGWEIVPYTDAEPARDQAPDEVVVGHIAAVRAGLRALGLPVPAELGYPEVLHPFLGRRLWQSTINEVAADAGQWPVFVKPIHAAKKFTGVLVRRPRDLMGCGDQHENTPVWCAEPVHFVAEWRCFVRYGRILDARPYKGDWRAHFDPAVVEQALGCVCARSARRLLPGRGPHRCRSHAGGGSKRWLFPGRLWADAFGLRQVFVGSLVGADPYSRRLRLLTNAGVACSRAARGQ